MQKQFVCMACNADFKLSFKLDPSVFQIEFCPFCGEILEEELENNDEEDTY